MKVNFLTTRDECDGYGMVREWLLQYMPKYDILLEPADAGNDVTLILHIPPAIEHAKSPIKILYTMVEGDTVPDSWKKHLEKATHILVPSEFVAKTFAKAGFDSTVVPLGYVSDVFKFTKKENKEPYTFLHYEAFQNRKGWEALLEAWLLSGLAEQEHEAKLVLKTIKPFKEIQEKITDLFIPYNVEIMVGKLPHECMFHLLKDADCFVFPSRGEGFSLPPLEAMATGTPVILTKGHSHMDYYNEEYMYGVDADIKIPARYHNWEDQGNFVRCKNSALADVLQKVYYNKREATKKAQKAAEYVKKYSFENTAKNLSEVIWRLVN